MEMHYLEGYRKAMSKGGELRDLPPAMMVLKSLKHAPKIIPPNMPFEAHYQKA